MKKYAIVLIIIISTNFLFSQTQKADIIFNDGAVLEGYGMIINKHEIKFRINLNEEPDVWTNLMVKRIIFYGFEISKTYEYIKLKEKKTPELLEVISEGKVTLYSKKDIFWSYTGEHKMMSSLNKVESFLLYVKRKKETIATSFNGNFKKIIKNYFNDCDVIMEMVESGEYKKQSREGIVNNYNIFCED